MSILDLLHHGLDLRRLCHVALDHQRLLQLIRHIHRIRLILTFRVSHVIGHALRAVFPERFDHLRANPARAAGDQHDFASEIQRIRHNRKED